MKKITAYLLSSIPGYLFARNARGETITLRNPLHSDDVITIIESILDWLIAVGGPIAIVFIIWGAFQIMTAGGDTTKFGNGKKTILYALLGYGIIFCAWGLVNVIQSVLSE